MRCKGLLRKTASLFLCFLLCMACLTLPVSADTGVNTQQVTSLTVHFGIEGMPFPNVAFRLYKVADMSSNAKFTLAGGFVNYPVQLDDLDSTGWRDMGETLSAYVVRDKIAPTKEGTTDVTGQLTFTDLEVGLYLLMGDSYQYENYLYSSSPQLVALPNRNEMNVWEYNVKVTPKVETASAGQREDISRKVIKVWKDSGYKNQRPKNVKVELLQDGEVYDTVTLNSENNWRYTWEKLPAGHQWRVVETNVPYRYKVKVSRNEGTFTITNTYKKPKPEPEPPEPTPSSPPTEPTLPQTGMLWWPVPVLAAVGMALFFVGWWIRRNGENADE